MAIQQRSMGRAPAVAFALGESSLGTVLVARSARGVCAIFIGADRAEVEPSLRQKFRQARCVEDGDEGAQAGELRDDLSKVIAYIEDPRRELDLELDLCGTEFQRRVWLTLRQIPRGQTSTYTEIAGAIGQPTAARAVAGACAANLVSVAIPCHRVLRSDGSLSGYRWGVARKRALLEREGVLQEQSLL